MAKKRIGLNLQEIQESALSDLSLLRLANRFPDRFITVGKKIDYTGGIGLPPFEYVLPYSKIMVRLPSAVETHTNPLKIWTDHTPMFENPTEAADNYHLDKEGVFL